MSFPPKLFKNGGLSAFGVGAAVAGLAALMAGMVASAPEKFDGIGGISLKQFVNAPSGHRGDIIFPTAVYDLAITTFDAPADPGEGGAIEALGEDIFLITRLGDFHRLNARKGSFEKIGLAPPAKPVTEDIFYKRAKDFSSLGYKDFILRPVGEKIEATVSEARVDPGRRCVSVIVSQALLEKDVLFGEAAANTGVWRQVWESQPCITSAGGSFPFQSGGDMAFLPDGRLAIFVGDFGVDGHNRRTKGVSPQTLDNDYGKVIAIDTGNGVSQILSRGHRNPGGLTIGANGDIWQSEHGAQGGDEVNRIVAGGNYGWPLETYGTHYGMKTWPPDSTTGTHDDFAKPVYAFVPSQAVSSMETMAGKEFPYWTGDLILGVLKYQQLMRLHVRDERVVFAEPIKLGARVRDLTIDAKGRIYVKDDVRPSVYRIANAGDTAPVADSAEAVLAAAGCNACHGGADATAPGLADIAGRKVAGAPGYAYSSGLKAVGGHWNEETLRAFLKDPQSFAPGASMPAADLSEEQIEAVVAALMAEGQDG